MGINFHDLGFTEKYAGVNFWDLASTKISRELNFAFVIIFPRPYFTILRMISVLMITFLFRQMTDQIDGLERT